MERNPVLAQYLAPALRDWGHIDVLQEIRASMLILSADDKLTGRGEDKGLTAATAYLTRAIRALEEGA